MNDTADPIDASVRCDFLKTEYQEAAKAYSLGVQAGQDLMRQFLSGNVFLATLFGAVAGVTQNYGLKIRWPIVIIPVFAILASVTMISTVPHYRNLLNACRRRCCEIERMFGGSLYTGITAVSDGARFGAVFGLSVICVTFTLFWIAMLLIAWKLYA